MLINRSASTVDALLCKRGVQQNSQQNSSAWSHLRGAEVACVCVWRITMSDQQSGVRPSAISLTDTEIERRRTIVGLTAEDAARLMKLRDLIAQDADRY